MIGSYISRPKLPFASFANFANRFLNWSSLQRFEFDWSLGELFAIVVFPLFIPGKTGCAVAVMKSVDRATPVAMKPRTGSAEGYVETEWEIGHDGVVYESTTKSLTVVTLTRLTRDAREFVVCWGSRLPMVLRGQHG